MLTSEKKQPKQKAPKKPTKDQKQQLVDEKIDALMVARRSFSESCLEYEQAHAESAAKKKTMEKWQADLNTIIGDIDRIRSGNYTLPLFGEWSETITIPGPSGHSVTVSQEPPKESAADAGHTPGTLTSDGPWRDVPLSTLFHGSILQSLVKADLGSIGHLCDYTASDKRITDIPGIGPGKGQTIENTMLAFWRDNPQEAEEKHNAV